MNVDFVVVVNTAKFDSDVELHILSFDLLEQ